VKELLKETITLLCKNGLHFKSKFSIEAVIGITLDEGDDVFIVSINETVCNSKEVIEKSVCKQVERTSDVCSQPGSKTPDRIG